MTTAKANAMLTPGTLVPGITVEILKQPDYDKRTRPTKYHEYRMKLAVMKNYGIPRLKILSYTLDHLIAIENGGNPCTPADLSNVWPQPKKEAIGKDHTEYIYHRRILDLLMTIEDAAAAVRRDWSQ